MNRFLAAALSAVFFFATPATAAEISGIVALVHIDSEDPHYAYLLRTPAGEIVELTFKKEPPIGITGSRLRLRGERRGASLDVESFETLASAPPIAPYQTLGASRVALLNVNFADNAQQPWTPQQAADTVNATVNDKYDLNSHGLKWFITDPFGWWTMPISYVGCSTVSFTEQALDQAALHGVDLSVYQHVIISFPSVCSGPPAGTVGPSRWHPYSISWTSKPLQWWTTAHELGHNMSLGHADRIDCPGVPLSGDPSTCKPVDGGWFCDWMGTGCAGSFNAAARSDRWMGWDAALVITQPDTYRLYPIEQDFLEPRVLKILRSRDLTTGDEQWVYIERRVAQGLDSGMSVFTNLNYTKGVILTIAGDIFHNGYDLNGLGIDMTPSVPGTLWDGALVAGMCYEDALAGFAISLVGLNADGSADVAVTFGGAGCGQPPPPPPPSNNPPIANPDAATAPWNSTAPITIPVLLNDRDDDGDPLTITFASQGGKGSTVIVPGGVRYTPRRPMRGIDSFTYTISDGHPGGTASANVTVTTTQK